MLSKIFTQTLKPILAQSLRNKSINQTFFRAMATSDVASVDRAKQKLDKALSREIKFEEENYRYDQSVNKFLEENGFSLRDPREDDIVELTKKVGSVTVQIVFQSRPPLFIDEDEEDDDEKTHGSIQKLQETADDEPQFDDRNFGTFTININFISIVKDVQGHKQSSKLTRPKGYRADFSILDERLQSSFLEYLKGFGVNEDVALFVEHFSQDKDQRQYMEWLKDVDEFIERPLD